MATRREQMRFIAAVREFGRRRLGLEFDGSFKRFVGRNRTANWIYVVEPTGLTSALPGRATYRFTWDLGRARRWERYHRARGRHTYLYSAEGHGGRACPITPSLLAAPRARQGYVVLHEAWHATLRLAEIRMPYALEEATGRVVGVLGTSLFAAERGDDELLAESRAQERSWAAFARFVNRGYRRLAGLYRRGAGAGERRRLLAALRREADALRERLPAEWERAELTKEMNNAFFFRYHDYTCFHPLALRVYRIAGSLPRAMRLYKRAGREGALAQLRAYGR